MMNISLAFLGKGEELISNKWWQAKCWDVGFGCGEWV
jgi:hypothetical protein